MKRNRGAFKEHSLSEGSQSENIIYYMIPSMIFWKRKKYGGSKKNSNCYIFRETKGERDEKTEGIFGAMKLIYKIL